MERCFIIEEIATLHKEYFDYVKLRNENNETIKKFVDEHITQGKKDFLFYDGSNFCITLSDEEYERFKNQVKVGYSTTEKGRMYEFKKNSALGKAWTALNLKPARKPMPIMEFISIFDARTRLFDYEGVLYCSMDSHQITKDTKAPSDWCEISKSDFYAVIDKIEKDE